MDVSMVVAAASVIAVLGLAAFLLLRARTDTGAGLAAAQAELAGRITQLTETQTGVQIRMDELMQRQERTVTEQLAEVTRRVGESLQKSGNEQQSALSSLKERLVAIDVAQKNLAELSSQMVGLQDILSNKQARGAFGEIQLADLVQSILPPSAYVLQATLGNGKRVDCLLSLPNPPGTIAIDAKFPLESYHALQAADTDDMRDKARRALKADVLKHVKDIADKYILPGETAESALMFLPSEAVYAELHANLQAAVEQSYRARVWIVSPTTLMATLNTVRAVLKDVRMREQAHVIQIEVGKLLEDVGRLDQRVGSLETHFRQAERDIREIRISGDKISKRSERIEAIEVGDIDEIGQENALPDSAEIAEIAHLPTAQ